jgi:hypothetical protein
MPKGLRRFHLLATNTSLPAAAAIASPSCLSASPHNFSDRRQDTAQDVYFAIEFPNALG